MDEIKKFEYEGNEITFLTGEATEINATEMAKRFSAKPNDWLKTDSAQRMISAISISRNVDADDLVRIVAGGTPEKQGTWMHEDVAIVFAQWLSPELYIWCNDRIKELFKYGITAMQPEVREIVFKLSEATGKLKENSSCKIGKRKIYEMLRLKGILNKYNKPLREYIDKGYFKLKYYYEDSYAKYPVATEDGMKWLNQMLYPELMDIENKKYEELSKNILLALEGIDAIGETILYSKGGVKTEEQNRIITANLRTVMEKIKKITQSVVVVK